MGRLEYIEIFVDVRGWAIRARCQAGFVNVNGHDGASLCLSMRPLTKTSLRNSSLPDPWARHLSLRCRTCTAALLYTMVWSELLRSAQLLLLQYHALRVAKS
jgi:hypothetical protein